MFIFISGFQDRKSYLSLPILHECHNSVYSWAIAVDATKEGLIKPGRKFLVLGVRFA